MQCRSVSFSRFRSGYWQVSLTAAQTSVAAAILLLFAGSAPVHADAESEAQALEIVRQSATNVQFHHADGTVQYIRFSKPEVTDDCLAPLHRFPRLQYLSAIVPQVTDRGLIYISARKELDTLVLSQSGITDAGVEIIAGLPKLERLYLDRTAVTDAGVERLRGLTSLKVLSLRDTAVTNAGTAWLTGLSGLEALILDGTAIDDQALASLATLTNLQSLYLNNTRVTGSDLSALAGLANLQQLNLSGCPVAQLDAKTLATLPKLTTVSLFHVKLEPAELARVTQELPATTKLFGVPRSKPVGEGETAADSISELVSDVAAVAGEVLAPCDVRMVAAESVEVPDFQRHVTPLLGRLGCNSRNCHGAFQGQAGFRLSLFGYEFLSDHEAMTKGDEPRVNIANPADSLVLLKPTMQVDHDGGERFKKDGWEYRLLSRWIAAGAPTVAEQHAHLVRLELTPAEIVFAESGLQQQLTAVAVWSDGTREDVTPLTRFTTNDDRVAEISPAGLVKGTGAGDTHVICSYDNAVEAVPVLLPVAVPTDNVSELVASSRIDALINDKLRKLGMQPSELCGDAEFLRRVSLDLTGSLPTPDEVRTFIADETPSKRLQKIDELLERPAYVRWWTTRLCDLTGQNAGYLGSTEMAEVVAAQWQRWMERRVRDNVGWDQIAKGMLLATSRDPGQTYEEYIVKQSNFTNRTNPTDYTALDNTMSHYWYRDNQTLPKEKALALGYVFLGVRLECAECHKHPFDRWSQQDFQQFTAFFERIKKGVAPDAADMHQRMEEMLGVPVKLNTAALRRQEYLRVAAEGRPIPWNEVYIEPPGDQPQPARLLGEAEVDLSQVDDPRTLLVDWLLKPDNPYFASAFVNRIWANYFHVGIVDPPDDFNRGNPPSNGPLLDYLRKEFVKRNYDIKWLHREIASSDAYQRSVASNSTNVTDERNFSRAVIRRLPAEVIMDAVAQATAGTNALKTAHANVEGRNIGDHPKSDQKRSIDYSLLVFGKPLRTVNCDCERRSAPTLLQSLFLRNDKEVFELMDRPDGWVTEFTQSPAATDVTVLIDDLYLRTMCRSPSAEERELCLGHFREAESTETAFRDLLWSLLNAQEFVTNH